MANKRTPSLLALAKHSACVRCEADDGTIVGAHYTGIRQHAYGKGRGLKGSDIAVAFLCRACHEYFDQPAERKSIERSEEFLHCIMLTLMKVTGS